MNKNEFRTNDGQKWVVHTPTIGTVARVREFSGVDLTKVIDPESSVLVELGEPITLTSVLFAWLEPDDLILEEFQDLFSMDSLSAAADAICESLLNFFSGSQAKVYRVALDQAKAEKRKISNQVDQAIASLPGHSSIEPPASSE